MNRTLQLHRGIILKKIPYSEADEIVTVLLQKEGVHRFFAAGSRKSKKRFKGLVDYFAHLNFSYRPSTRGLWRLLSVEEIADFQNRGHQIKPTQFAYLNLMAELICEFTPEHDGDHGLYDLWFDIQEDCKDNTLSYEIASKFLLRFFDCVGYGLGFERKIKPDENWKDLLKELVRFSEKIMQKPSQAAGFLWNEMG